MSLCDVCYILHELLLYHFSITSLVVFQKQEPKHWCLIGYDCVGDVSRTSEFMFIQGHYCNLCIQNWHLETAERFQCRTHPGDHRLNPIWNILLYCSFRSHIITYFFSVFCCSLVRFKQQKITGWVKKTWFGLKCTLCLKRILLPCRCAMG